MSRCVSRKFSVVGDQVDVRGVYLVALAFGVAVFVLADVHDKAGDGADRRARSRAAAGLVLILLVIGFPAPTEFEACGLAVASLGHEGLHRAPLHMAEDRKPGFRGQKASKNAQYQRLENKSGFPD